ncbi:MAG: hypothetical protein EOO66_32715, partial [Methylobacterium sp.]
MTPSNAGSRNGLITWAVIASVVGFGSLIWATISFTQANKAQKDLEAIQQQYTNVIDRPGLTGAEINALTDIRSDKDRGFAANAKLLDVSVQRTNALTGLIAGQGTTDDKKATAEAQAAIEAAKKAAGEQNAAAIETTSLNAALTSAAAYISKLNGDIAGLNTELATARKEREAALAEKGRLATAADEAVKNFQTQAEA